MTEQELKLIELTEKAKNLDQALRAVNFRVHRTRKNIKVCKETCKETNKIIGELNARNVNK